MRRSSVLLGCLSLSLAACNALLGVEELEDNAGQPGGTSGSSGAAGKSASGGASGAGNGGAGASGGPSGTGGAGQSGAAGSAGAAAGQGGAGASGGSGSAGDAGSAGTQAGASGLGGLGGANGSAAGAGGEAGSGQAGAGSGGAGASGEAGSGGAGAGGAGGAVAGGTGGAGAGGAGQGGAGAGGAGGQPAGGGGAAGSAAGNAGAAGSGGSSCSNKTLDGDETGVDCGGGCPKCAALSACKKPSDCISNVCSNGVCKDSCFVDQDPSPIVGGKLEVKQFFKVSSPRHPLALSPNGKFALSAQWGGGTRTYKRSADGLLLNLDSYSYPPSDLGSTGAGFLSNERVLISVDCCDKEYLYDLPFESDGSLPLTPPKTIGGTELREVFWLTPTVSLLADGKNIRRVVDGVYSSTNLVTGQEITRLSRLGDWLYWTEGFNNDQILERKLARSRVDCDGNLQPPQYLPIDKVGMSVVSCPTTGRIYTGTSDVKDPNFEGVLWSINTNDCASDLGLCTPKKAVTRGSVPTLYNQPNMMAISPDCSTLYVASMLPSSTPGEETATLNVFSLTDPDAPALVQVIEGGKTYGDVTLEKYGAPWAVVATREAVYWSLSFGKGIVVLQPTP